MLARRASALRAPRVLLVHSALGGRIARFDEAAERSVARLRGNAVADRVFYRASSLGEFSLIWMMLALARALRGGRANERAGLRTVAGAIVEFVLVNGLLKSAVGRKRPLELLEHPLPFRQPLTSSFPSGHASAAFCGATLLAEGDPLAPLYYLVATAVAASRVYVKIHHASDVVGGAVIGLALGRLLRRLMPLERSNP